MFATLKSAVRSHKFGDLEAYPYVVSAETSIFDLSMTLVQDIDQKWWAQVEYNTNLFNQERVGRMLTDYISVLEGVLSDPEGRILTLQLPSIPGPVDASLAAGADQEAIDNDKPASVPATRSASGRGSRPLDREQELLVEIWKEVLGLQEVGIRESFFDIGGHSLIAVRLISRIQEVTGLRLPVAAIFRAPTIEGFAPLLRENIVVEPDPILVKLKDGDGVVPFFAIAGPGLDTFGLSSLLALHMGKDQSAYKVQASGPIVWGRPFTKTELRDLAREYIAAMRSVQPHGPYCIGGMCEGVLIAQEIVLELESQQEEVGVFAIFDTWVLENSQIRALWAVDYYRQRFQIFRSLSRPERLATTKRFVRRLLGKNGESGETSGSGWSRIYWPGEGFREPRFQAPVFLFKRTRQPYYYVRDRQMGWGVRSAGGVEICELNCEHLEFLRQPQVGIVGQLLSDRLQSIRRDARRQTEVSSAK